MLLEKIKSDGHGGRRVAVVGSGIAGLSAAWLLAKRHRVTLFEADHRAGGHSNTVNVPTRDGPIPVDTGFIVYNDRNYPNLVALFDHLRVETSLADMAFGVSIDNGRLEYGSSSVNAMLGQRMNTFNPRFLSMLLDLVRFYYEAPALMRRADLERLTLGDFLASRKYAAGFVEDHLLPMGAAIWSTTVAEMRAYPLLAFLRFFWSHGLLDLNLLRRPNWRSVKGGSRMYVQRLLREIGDVRIGAAVTQIRRGHGLAEVTAGGVTEPFSDVVIATHADDALKLLADSDDEERAVLGAFRYTDNTAVLHRDPAQMPKLRRVWASWNYVGETPREGDERPLCVSYWMNRLQDLPTQEDIFVTLNPIRPIAEGALVEAINYSHPLFDRAALDAQGRMPRLQGRRNTWFCGAYLGYGFHEDGIQSGLMVAEAIGGARRPWAFDPAQSRVGTIPGLAEAAE